MKQLKIKIHSVVDIITNSSTTTYVQATDGTIKAVKEMVNVILKIAGSKETANTLFKFTTKDREINEYREEHITHSLHRDEFEDLKYNSTERRELIDKYLTQYANETPDWWDDEEMKSDAGYGDSDDYSNIDLIVTAKTSNENTKLAAKILSNLDGIFNYESEYNG